MLSPSLPKPAAPRRACRRSYPRARRLECLSAAKPPAAPHEAPGLGGSSPPPAPAPRDVGATVPSSALAPRPPSVSLIVGPRRPWSACRRQTLPPSALPPTPQIRQPTTSIPSGTRPPPTGWPRRSRTSPATAPQFRGRPAPRARSPRPPLPIRPTARPQGLQGGENREGKDTSISRAITNLQFSNRMDALI
jgi:hypothetical protein